MTWGKLRYDGHKTAVTIPVEEMEEFGYNPDKTSDYSYMVFGRACDKDEEGAKRTNWSWRSSGEVIYAKPVESDGFGGTGKMYGADGYVYLQRDGLVYVRSYAPKKTRYLRVHLIPEEEAERTRKTLP
jgi:hypothetical protein